MGKCSYKFRGQTNLREELGPLGEDAYLFGHLWLICRYVTRNYLLYIIRVFYAIVHASLDKFLSSKRFQPHMNYILQER
jgi:hypothetical protein